MNTVLNYTDEELLEEIKNCTLKPESFTHKTMLRLAWILIKKYGVDVAIIKNNNLKENYYKKALNSTKFNKPLTKAYVDILYFFMQKSKKSDFEKLLREFPRLIYNFKSLVKTHYGHDILKEDRKKDLKLFDRPVIFTL
jgi:hypothetical protein